MNAKSLLQDRINLLQNFILGKQIQFRSRLPSSQWLDMRQRYPKFNWEAYEYRMKPTHFVPMPGTKVIRYFDGTGEKMTFARVFNGTQWVMVALSDSFTAPSTAFWQEGEAIPLNTRIYPTAGSETQRACGFMFTELVEE